MDNIEITFVDISNIVSHDDLPYRTIDPKHATELAKDISINGLDIPLGTWGGGEDQVIDKAGGKTFKPHYLVAGGHRLEALKALKKQTPKKFARLFPNGIPVIHRLGSLEDMLSLALRENIQRKKMSPDEVLPYLEQLIASGMTQAQIGKTVGRHETWVSQMVTIQTQLPDDVVEDVKKGKVSMKDAREISSDAKRKRKAGEDVSDEDIREKADAAKAKTETQKAAGKSRADKTLTAKYLKTKLDAHFNSGVKLSVTRKLELCTQVIEYLVEKDPSVLDKTLLASEPKKAVSKPKTSEMKTKATKTTTDKASVGKKSPVKKPKRIKEAA